MRSRLRATAESNAGAAEVAEAQANVEAVNAVVTALAGVRTVEAAVESALRVVRERFGWSYGSYWEVDPATNRLRFAQESGDTTPEFRQVTLAATFGLGEGLSGRAWQRRELVFVADLGDVR